MYNWSTDTTRLKENPSEYDKFILEQMINFGLQGQKISEKNLRKYWDSIDIDPHKRAFLAQLLWPQS